MINFGHLYLVTVNSSTIISLPATYKNVPVDRARNIALTHWGNELIIIPSTIPEGVNKAKTKISFIKVNFSVLALLKAIPYIIIVISY